MLVFYIKTQGNWGLGIGDWGFGDWGLGPIPNPQSPTPKYQHIFIFPNNKILKSMRFNDN